VALTCVSPSAPASGDEVGVNRSIQGSTAVFLDRDGVLNEAVVRNGKPYPPASPAELHIPAGTAQALAR